MKLSEKTYNWLIKSAKKNGNYMGTNNFERACVLFERTKKDYKTASFHTVEQSYVRVKNGECIPEDSEFYYICLNEEGRNNYAMKFIYNIRKYEDKVEYYRNLVEYNRILLADVRLADVREKNDRLKERD